MGGQLQKPPKQKSPVAYSATGLFLCNGGEIGIRTLGTGEGTTDFESVPFGHSGISPTARIITAWFRKAKLEARFFSVLSDACVD
jgi:hypothetical protein